MKGGAARMRKDREQKHMEKMNKKTATSFTSRCQNCANQKHEIIQYCKRNNLILSEFVEEFNKSVKYTPFLFSGAKSVRFVK